MTPAQLAARLNGIEYPTYIPNDLLAEAKASGLVIVWGASDDLMEFYGAISGEIGADHESKTLLDAEGLLPDWNYLLENNSFKGTFRDYFRRESNARTIKAFWGRNGYSWSYETDIPHATFDVMEDGSKYCRGIVFLLADLKAAVEESAALASSAAGEKT